MTVHRIATQCLSEADGFRRAAELTGAHQEDVLQILVVSPVKGQAEAVENLAQAATKGFPEEALGAFTALHSQLGKELGIDENKEWKAVFERMGDLLHGIGLVKHCTPRTQDLLLSLTAKLSALLLQSALAGKGKKASLLDSTEGLLLAKPAKPYPEIDRHTTRQRIRTWAEKTSGAVIVTGFLAVSEDGTILSMGRNGGDYTASLFAEALGARELVIWTDSDGLPAAESSLVPNARRIRHMGFEEAMELAYFGSDILHPYTMLPLAEAGIPLAVKNLSRQEDPGTLVSSKAPSDTAAITGITRISGVTLLNIEGGGMVGIPGFASRVFGALFSSGVNVIMISQASSEHSICVAVRETEAGTALTALGRELEEEHRTGRLRPVEITQPCSLVAVIGESMRGMRGLSGRVFAAAGKSGANILAIAQGSSERNISFAVHQDDTTATVRSLYHEFFGDNP